jgi:hypothetical protein
LVERERDLFGLWFLAAGKRQRGRLTLIEVSDIGRKLEGMRREFNGSDAGSDLWSTRYQVGAFKVGAEIKRIGKRMSRSGGNALGSVPPGLGDISQWEKITAPHERFGPSSCSHTIETSRAWTGSCSGRYDRLNADRTR